MAKNNTPPGESPEEVRAREEAEARAKNEAESKAREEADAQAKAAGESARVTVENAETKPALIRHKTQYPKYRCAGLVLTQKAETYQITVSQLEKLRNDPWVVIEAEPK
ncbi:MAG: hypothetical protein LBD18_04675 [Treponema sp.]|jgi:membrane protein involved in colicin uptake|nr:hypothetical protein [Treponema sp.]